LYLFQNKSSKSLFQTAKTIRSWKSDTIIAMKELNSIPQSTWTCGIRTGEFTVEILLCHEKRNVMVLCNRIKKPEVIRVTARLYAFEKVQGTFKFI
jgi:hypothetical protein